MQYVLGTCTQLSTRRAVLSQQGTLVPQASRAALMGCTHLPRTGDYFLLEPVRSRLTSSAGRRDAPTQPAAPVASPRGHGLVGSLPYNESEYLEVAVVTGVHGVRGELRLEVSSDEPAKRFKAGKRLYLLPPRPKGLAGAASPDALPLIPVTSQGCKMRPLGKGNEVWMVALQEVTSRTQAEQLRGFQVLFAAAERDRLRDPDEFYVSDIIGCSVVDQATGRLVGVVVDVFSGMGTHDTLRVKLRATVQDILNSRIRYCLIPFAKAICPVLDLESRTLQVSPPEGLLDMATVEPLRRPLSEEAKAQKLQQLKEQLRKESEEVAHHNAAASTSDAGRGKHGVRDGEEDDSGMEDAGEGGVEGTENEEEEQQGREQAAAGPSGTPRPRRLRVQRQPGLLRRRRQQ